MPEGDDDGLASKILLIQGAQKAKVRSWMHQSFGDEALSAQHDDTTEDLLPLKHRNDENAGIGATPTSEVEDENLDRHLSAANDALRRKLLSKDGYKRFQEKRSGKLDASKPVSRTVKVRAELSDDEAEAKGKGRRSSRKLVADSNADTNVGADDSNKAPISHTTKKRRGGYLDEILAQRSKKKKSKFSRGED